MLFSNTSEISYLLFLKVNPNAKCCPRFNLTSIINFTVLPLFNLIKMLFSNTSKLKNNRSLLNPIQSYFRSYFFEIRDRSYFF